MGDSAMEMKRTHFNFKRSTIGLMRVSGLVERGLVYGGRLLVMLPCILVHTCALEVVGETRSFDRKRSR